MIDFDVGVLRARRFFIGGGWAERLRRDVRQIDGDDVAIAAREEPVLVRLREHVIGGGDDAREIALGTGEIVADGAKRLDFRHFLHSSGLILAPADGIADCVAGRDGTGLRTARL